MTNVACESKLRSVVRSSMHPCRENYMAIRRAVVYYDQATHAFSEEIKCRHCIIHRDLWRNFGHLVHSIATRGTVVEVDIFPTDLLGHRSAIYPQGRTFKYGLGGRLRELGICGKTRRVLYKTYIDF